MTHFKFRRYGAFLLSSSLFTLLTLSLLAAGQAFAQTHAGRQHTLASSQGTRRANASGGDPVYTATAKATNECPGDTSDVPGNPVAVTPPLRKDTPVTVTGEVTQGTGNLVVYDDHSGQYRPLEDIVISISNGQGPQTAERKIPTNNDVLKACLQFPSSNAIGKVTVNLPTPVRQTPPTPTPTPRPSPIIQYQNGWREGCNWGSTDRRDHRGYHHTYHPHSNASASNRHGNHDGYEYGWSHGYCLSHAPRGN